jgi:hypothetical protein
VEPEKIQMMFEAARISSHWGNVQSLRGIAAFKNTASQEVLDALHAPVAGWQVRKAPVVIVWYCDPTAVNEQSDRLHELMDVGALGFGDIEERRQALDEVLLPIFDGIKDFLKEAGCQRPRQPFETLFSMNHYDEPFPRSEAVVEELTWDKFFTTPAPLPEREEELEFLQRALDLDPPGLLQRDIVV